MKEKISIVITTYNRYEYLQEAINSIYNQNYDNKEIIIVDDCSDDKRYEDFRHMDNIKYIRNEKNCGASESRKIGFSFVEGSYVIFMDDDDYYINNDFFSKAILAFTSNENLCFVSGNSDVYIQKTNEIATGNRLPFYGVVDVPKYLQGFQTKYIKPYSTYSTIFPVSIIKKDDVIGMKMFNDSSIYLAAMLYGRPYFLEDVIGHYRVHETNMTKKTNVNFIIENLEGKRQVCNKLDGVPFDKEKWFYQQVKLTCDYFQRESKPRIHSSLKILKWCCFNLKKKRLRFLYDWTYNIIFSYRVSYIQAKRNG